MKNNEIMSVVSSRASRMNALGPDIRTINDKHEALSNNNGNKAINIAGSPG